MKRVVHGADPAPAGRNREGGVAGAFMGRAASFAAAGRRVMLPGLGQHVAVGRGLPLVVVRLDVVLAHRVVLELVPHQDAPQVGMPVEDDAEKVENLPFLEFAGAPDRGQRGHGHVVGPVGRPLPDDDGAMLQGDRIEVVDDLKAAGLGPVDPVTLEQKSSCSPGASRRNSAISLARPGPKRSGMLGRRGRVGNHGNVRARDAVDDPVANLLQRSPWVRRPPFEQGQAGSRAPDFAEAPGRVRRTRAPGTPPGSRPPRPGPFRAQGPRRRGSFPAGA